VRSPSGLKQKQSHIGYGIRTVIVGNTAAGDQGVYIDTVRFNRRNRFIRIATFFSVQIVAFAANLTLSDVQPQYFLKTSVLPDICEDVSKYFFMFLRGLYRSLEIKGIFQLMNRLKNQSP
jgi:hypothetical protein